MSEEQQIKQVIEQYIQGTYEGSPELLENVFHSNAVMNGYLGEQLVLATPEVFIQDISQMQLKQNGADYMADISAIAVDGQVASATLVETGFPGGMAFTNYFHLINDGGGWKIISKTFIGKAA